METDPFLDKLTAGLVQRFNEDMELERIEQEERHWIIQRCTQKWTFRDGVSPLGIPIRVPVELIYEDWPGYDTPMNHAEMEAALDLCCKLWPDHEFLGHRISPGTVTGAPGSPTPTRNGEPGIFPKDGDQ